MGIGIALSEEAQFDERRAFGDIHSRPGLDLRAREIATIAALTAMDNAAPQLKVDMRQA
jgi:alkylhydroperoxidase/carboxymuconolactone decarboxylase family protein YurZ